jgi:ribosomal protein S18 acetylase RimI-like enzyme
MHTLRLAMTGTAVMFGAAMVHAASMDGLINTVKAVGPEGKGNEDAIRAVRELSGGSASTLLPLLKAMDDANPLAANWLRGAFEAIADREVNGRGQLPAAELEAFVVDTSHDPHARRLAYEWLLKVDPSLADRLIPKMLLDPGADFRRDAVQRLIDQAAALQAREEQDAAVKLYRNALRGATDDDQVQAIVKPLKELGETVDLQKHFGFIVRWKLIGPFDNRDLAGYDAVYPPEEKLDFGAKYSGKDGMEVTWTDFRTEDDYGVVDLRKALAPHKGAVTYAAAEFVVERPQTVELRLGTPNAWKLWVNGKLAFARDEYHRGTQLDQYRVPVKLLAGKNAILLKVCQNEQTEDWAQDWKFQLRVSDSSGAAVEAAGG